MKKVTSSILPKPDHELGYTESFLKTVFKGRVWKKFIEWMWGQTCAFIKEKGEPCFVYYPQDVEAFFVTLSKKGKDRQKDPLRWD